jgi:hypothetical protein
MDAQLVGSRKRPPIAVIVAAVALAIAVGLVATQVTHLWSGRVEGPAAGDTRDAAGVAVVDNLGTTHDRHVGSRGGPFTSQTGTEAAWYANVQGSMTPVREGGVEPTAVDPLLESGTFGRRKSH